MEEHIKRGKMKRLLLTSSGISSKKLKNVFTRLVQRPENKKVLVFYYEKYPKYLKKVEQELLSLKFKRENILFSDFKNNKLKSLFLKFDILYFMGGETFFILKALRKQGFDKLIKKFVNKGKIYVGASASSIIAGPSIEIASWGKTGEDHLAGLKPNQWKGLNLTNISIFPHYENSLKEEIPAFRKKIKNKYPVLPLRDRQALLVLGNKNRVIK
jgi:dipeptidase E